MVLVRSSVSEAATVTGNEKANNKKITNNPDEKHHLIKRLIFFSFLQGRSGATIGP
jgi:hypothetical protein